MQKLILVATLTIAIPSFVLEAGSRTKNSFSVPTLKKIAESTVLVEWPAKAAEIISSVPEEDQKRIAVRVVRLFLSRHHSLAPSLVGTIAARVPEVAAAVTAEAVSLFPEHAYSITKTAVAAAPEQAIRIALLTASVTLSKADTITIGVQRAIPHLAPQYLAILSGLVRAQRAESVDLAIFQVKVRISSLAGLNPTARLFAGVTQTTERDDEGNLIAVFEVDTESQDLPEDLSGQEVNQFDVVIRELLATENNPFTNEPVIQEYVQVVDKTPSQSSGSSGNSGGGILGNINAVRPVIIGGAVVSGGVGVVQSEDDDVENPFN